jgi:hypothetical protein
MYKAELIEKLSHIPDDEPLFLLRARDPIAEEIVREWARRAKKMLEVNKPKREEAKHCADLMAEWGETHEQKTPD